MSGTEVRRSVEELAQTLYEGSDPSGIPWVKRGKVIREPWLQVARKQLARFENPSEPSGRVGP
jgi:hypothetical protein